MIAKVKKQDSNVSVKDARQKTKSDSRFFLLSIAFLTFMFMLLAYGLYATYRHDYMTLGCLLVIPYGWIVAVVADKLKTKLMLNGFDKRSWIVSLLHIVSKIGKIQLFLLLIIALLIIIFYAIYGPFIGEWKTTIIVGCIILIMILKHKT